MDGTKKGQKLSIRVPPKIQNYSVIAAITPSKVLGFQVVQGGVKDEDFLGFYVL